MDPKEYWHTELVWWICVLFGQAYAASKGLPNFGCGIGQLCSAGQVCEKIWTGSGSLRYRHQSTGSKSDLMVQNLKSHVTQHHYQIGISFLLPNNGIFRWTLWKMRSNGVRITFAVSHLVFFSSPNWFGKMVLTERRNIYILQLATISSMHGAL